MAVNLARYQSFAQDEFGNLLKFPTVEVRRESDNGLASVFSDRAGTIPLGNPFTLGGDGFIAFYVTGNAYKITITQGSVSRVSRHVAIGTFSERDYNQPFFYAVDFGVKADQTTDDTTALQNAINATPLGGTLVLPPTQCRVVGSGNQCLLVTQPIHIIGGGWSSGLFFDGTPNTRDVIGVVPGAASQGYSFRDFAIVGSGARHAIAFDGGAFSLLYNVDIRKMLIGKTDGGASIYGKGSTSGVLAYSNISQCNLESIQIDTCGDGLLISNNVAGVTNSARCAILVTQVVGAGGLVIRDNVLSGVTSNGGIIQIERATGPIVVGNEIEMQGSITQTNGALVDIKGSTGSIIGPRVLNNLMNISSGGTGTLAGIRLGICSQAHVVHNWMNLRTWSGSPGLVPKHVIVTASASDSLIGPNDCGIDNVTVPPDISDAGARTVVDIPSEYITLTANQAGANSNSAQTWFPGGGPTTFTVADDSIYEFEGYLAYARTAGTTSHTTELLYGGTATIGSVRTEVLANAGTSGFFSGNTSVDTVQAVASGMVFFAATTSATYNWFIRIRGLVRFTGPGTFIPQIKFSAAPGGAPTMQINSFFRMRRLGADTFAARGFVS